MAKSNVVRLDDSNTNNISVPLKNLVKSPRNVRTTQVPLGGLPNSILANGLYVNLIVTPVYNGKKFSGDYAVEAGGRRLEALNFLLAEGQITQDYMVDVKVIDESDAINASLIENYQREAMHKADEFIAFSNLVNQGKAIEHVANVFGVSEVYVKGLLKLANASPEVFTEFRENKMTLEQLKALCLSDDHERQNLIWFGAQNSWDKNASNIRSAIIADELSATHKKVLFVGIDNYINAGGKTRVDLFTENGKGDTLTDIALLDSLYQEKFTESINQAVADGWAWAEFGESRSWEYLDKFKKIHKEKRELSEEEKAAYEALEARQDALDEKEATFYDTDYDDEEEENSVRNEIETEQQSINEAERALDAVTTDWPETKSSAGVFFYLANDGSIMLEEGLVRAEDAKKLQNEANPSDDETAEAETKPTCTLSSSLQATLATQRTGALQIAIAGNADKALVLLAHKLALSAFSKYSMVWEKSAVTITPNTTNLHSNIPNYEESEIAIGLKAIGDALAEKLPAKSDELLDWLLNQPQATIIELLAYCTSRSVDLTSPNSSYNDKYKTLGNLFALDIHQTWKPTAENYFSRVSKTEMLEVVKLTGVNLNVDVDKIKKGDLANQVANAVKDTKWLPDLLVI